MRQFLLITTIATTIACSSPTAPTPPPSILGQWVGTYSTITCNETGAAIGSNFCASIRIGGGMTYTPTQAGSNLGGTLVIDTFSIPVSGSITQSGSVSLSGSGPIGFGATLSLQTWQGTVVSNVLAGSTSLTITTPDPVGAATVTASFALQQ